MKSRSFKLYKEFPLSPKLGTIITFETSGEFSEQDCNTESHYVFYLKDCINYPEFWEEVITKFKVGDIIVDHTVIERIGKIEIIEEDFIRSYAKCKGFLSPFVLDKCEKANNNQIIKYYKTLGWKEGRKFKWDNDVWIVNGLRVNSDSTVSVLLDNCTGVFIDNCELLPECEVNIQIIDNLSSLEKYLLDNNWEFRDEEYGLEFYTSLPLQNELVYWDNELSIKSLFEEEVIIMLSPTINEIQNLLKTFN